MAELTQRPTGLRGAAALKFLWEQVLIPLAEAMADGVDRAVEDFKPDLIIADQQAFAGALSAITHDIGWVTSATTSGELVGPLDALPLVDAAVRDMLVGLQVRRGIDPTTAASIDLRFSPLTTLAYTTAELVGDGPFPGPVTFVGPSVATDPTRESFPWEWLDESRPTVLVSLGTLNADAGERFWSVAAEACRDQDFQAIFVAPDNLVQSPPDNVLIAGHVPQVALLEHVDAVVSHAGHNTVCESLAAGVPLVVAPIRDDQPIVAAQVVRAGAGVRVKFARVRAAELRDAISSAMNDPALRTGAARIRDSFLAAGGPPAAADHLEMLTCPN